jgi:hypothetical protein
LEDVAVFQVPALLVAILLSPLTLTQDTQPSERRIIRKTPFQKAIKEATRLAVSDGTLTRGEAMKLNFAMRAPSFRRQAERLAITQMAFSDKAAFADALPRDSNGKIDRAAIDWQALLGFLKEFIPWLLDLLRDFGILDLANIGGSSHVGWNYAFG